MYTVVFKNWRPTKKVVEMSTGKYNIVWSKPHNIPVTILKYINSIIHDNTSTRYFDEYRQFEINISNRNCIQYNSPKYK